MIRSSQHPLKYSNSGKKETLLALIHEYRRFCQVLVDDIWENGIPEWGFFPKKNKIEGLKGHLPLGYMNRFPTWLSARMKQSVSAMVTAHLSSSTEKRRMQLWKLRELQRAGLQTKYLQSKIDRQPLVKPSFSKINPELDSRFVDFKKGSKKFEFLRISSIGNRAKIKVPLPETKISRKLVVVSTFPLRLCR